MSNFRLVQVSSLERVFLDSDMSFTQISSGSALRGERYSYQLAFNSDVRATASLSIESPLSDYITIRLVGNVPSEMPCYPDHDNNCERTNAGLFPDVLYPIVNNEILVKPNNWYSLYITVDIPPDSTGGIFPITVSVNDTDKIHTSSTFNLKIINVCLPEQKLIYTQWFHADCIADYYNVAVFSPKHWELIESFIRTAVHTGVNMLLTPIFTPPLDTAVGGERTTIQLVDIKLHNGKYCFGFDKLLKWIHIAKKNGIKYFEISHLFSQWGAQFAPKIIAEKDGSLVNIFGWHTRADSYEYSEFLKCFLPELIKVLKQEKVENNTFFHISDEPSHEQAESYKSAKSIVSDILNEFPIIDALSDYEFYDKGLVDNPIPCTTEIESFIEKGFPHPWTYYCCGQYKQLSNRFFSMPLSRTRAIGLQLYKYSIEGFLQWGFNFYNSQYSTRKINPFLVTDADSAFPSGDSFTVYPYDNGAIESIRSEAFFESLQDMRALDLLEGIIGKDETVKILEKEYGTITFTNYPSKIKDILSIRERINSIVEEKL